MNKKVIIPILIILLAAIGVLVYLYMNQKQEMTEMVEQMEFEKSQLEDEYEDLAMQFDGYRTPDIHNDSLAQLLNQEQQRVRDLLEELRITKATNARRIAELKKELATVREVMVSYVHQIDSLNQTNQRLTAENKQVREQYAVVQQQAEELQQQNTHLTEKVTRASMLEITAFSVLPLNKRDRKTSNLDQMQKIQFNFTIGKNITADRGLKRVYMRIVRPDGELITLPNPQQRMFAFENAEIEYSLSKEFEYGGEAIDEILYWTVGEILYKGTYNADFFIDGALIASFPFELKR
ncbi:MAG: hypothetical protein J6T76_06985 [Paludibacteraceae bacterium]|jgi:hypothetical protein|nr:hypothetical protein [Paludibacteraceae bacterium]MBO7456124.1 hypothetical protein [Paludibacteraceae bacterium]